MGEFELLISEHILDEVVRNLAKPYFVKHVHRDVYREMLTAFAGQASFVEITQVVSGVASHPEDDAVLSAAVSAAADYLVTGDHKLQELGSFHGSEIVSPNTFQAILGH